MIGNSKDRPVTEKAPDPALMGEPPAQRRLDPLRRSRLSGTWAGLCVFALILVLITDFVLQNTNSVKVSFLFWSWHVPLAVALMVAVAGGILVTSLAGTVRMIRMRRRVRRDRSRR